MARSSKPILMFDPSNSVDVIKYVYFCGNAGKEVKKIAPTIVPYLTQSPSKIKRVLSKFK